MDKSWISATATHNYFNEPLLDWFKYTQPQRNVVTNKSQYKSYLMTQGDLFETQIVNLITKKLKNIINIDGNLKAHDQSKYQETINAMTKGYYAIFSGVLYNYKNKTFGVPDILIRSDIIDKLITNSVLDIDEEVVNAPKLGKQKWHYRVIDIKFMTLMLKSDGETLLNSGNVPAYKSQLLIYNEALGETQGYTPNQAYLLGRRWTSTKSNILYYNDYCFDKLGIIDFEEGDSKYIEMTDKAIKWIKACKRPIAKKWNVTKYPLQRKELYPNMSNQQDSKWKERKCKIASDNNELTELWYVGKKNRDTALEKGIYNWKDKRLNAEILGVGGNTGRILDKIIEINRGTKLMAPLKIENNLYDWKNMGVEFFVDFEFKNAVFDPIIKLPVADTSIILFMIGIGYVDNGKWIFKSFVADYLSEKCEEDICEQFINYINKRSNGKAKLWHWSQAESLVFNNILVKYKSIRKMKKLFEWCDLLKVFQTEPIVIKGAMNFKLKSIANAMYQHGFISTIWDDQSGISDGITAVSKIVEANQNKKLSTQPIVKSVIKYNEIDVKVLMEILSYIRSLNKRKAEPIHNTRSVKKKIK